MAFAFGGKNKIGDNEMKKNIDSSLQKPAHKLGACPNPASTSTPNYMTSKREEAYKKLKILMKTPKSVPLKLLEKIELYHELHASSSGSFDDRYSSEDIFNLF